MFVSKARRNGVVESLECVKVVDGRYKMSNVEGYQVQTPRQARAGGHVSLPYSTSG